MCMHWHVSEFTNYFRNTPSQRALTIASFCVMHCQQLYGNHCQQDILIINIDGKTSASSIDEKINNCMPCGKCMLVVNQLAPTDKALVAATSLPANIQGYRFIGMAAAAKYRLHR